MCRIFEISLYKFPKVSIPWFDYMILSSCYFLCYRNVRADVIESRANIQPSTQHSQGNSNDPASRAANLAYASTFVGRNRWQQRRLEVPGGPASLIYRDSANSYANAKAPAACRHCSLTGVPVSPGLTYYTNFRKTLTGGTRVIDTHPLAADAASRSVSSFPESSYFFLCLGLTMTRRFQEKWKKEKMKKEAEEWVRECMTLLALLIFL